MAKFRILPESEVQARVDEATALLTGHENDPNAHGLGVVKDTVALNGTRLTTLHSMVRTSVPMTFTDTFDVPDAASLNATRWKALFTGLPKIVGNAAVAAVAGANIYAAVRPTTPDVYVSAVVDIPTTATGEASIITRYDLQGNHVLTQLGAAGALNLYAITGNGATYTLLKGAFIATLFPTMSFTGVQVEVIVTGLNYLLYLNGQLALTATLPPTLNTTGSVFAGIRCSGTCAVQSYAHGTLDGSLHFQRARMNTALAFRRSTISGKDTFDRADTASIGTAETGGSWSFLLNKLPAVVSNAAKFTSAADADMAYLNVSAPHVLLRAIITTPAASDYAGVTLRFGTSPGTRMTRIERRGDGSVYMVRYDGSAYITTLIGWREVSGSPEYLYALVVGADLWVMIDGHFVAYVPLVDDPASYNKNGICLKGTATVQDFLMNTVDVGVLA